MRARLHDADDRLGLRLVLLSMAAVLLLAPVVAGPLLSAFHAAAAPIATALGGLLALVAPALVSRTRPRDVDVRLGFNWIEARRPRGPWERIEGRSLGAARIARAAEGASLAVARGRQPPLLLELRDEADARAVQVALGAPGAEGDAVAWAMERSWLEGVASTLLWGAVVLWIALAAAGLTPGARWSSLPFDLPAVLVVVAAVCTALAPVLAGLGRALRPRMVLDEQGVRVGSARDAPLVPYVLIADVRVVGEGLEIELKRLDDKVASHPRIVPLHGLTPLERAHVATHVLSLARDAQGWGRGRRAETLRVLRRAEGEPVAGWLQRVDALAPKQTQPVYREGNVEKAELTRMLDDPASPRDVRIAAARVLRRIDPDAARPHVEALEGTSSSPDEAQQVQATIEAELEEAAAAYDALRPAFRALRR